MAPLTGSAPASAAPAFNQCSSIEDTPGLEVRCTVTITNREDLGTGVDSSTAVATVCTGAAGTTPNGACTTTTTTSDQLVTSVSQCDAAANGGGGNVFCSVAIVNDVVGAPALLGVSVNECIGSGTGGGADPLLCDPVQSTTGATVTQCDGSVDGGGADGRVDCTVTGATSAIAVLVNQCNDSVNGGGSTATCAVSFSNSVTPETAPVAVPTPTPTPTPTTGPGSGGTGSGGTGPTSGIIGGSGTGTVGTAGNRLAFTGVDVDGFLAYSLLTLLAGGVLIAVAKWRRRVRTV